VNPQAAWFVVCTVDGKDLDWWQYENEQDARREAQRRGGQVVCFVRGGWVPA